MKFAQRVFLIAGIYGLAIIAPLYFLESYVSETNPPAITHPEFYYGFVGVGLAWQIVFLIIARDPVRYRPLMPAAMLEKFPFAIAIYVLYAMGRVSSGPVAGATGDVVLGVLFVIAYLKTGAYLKNGNAESGRAGQA